jgi:prepilin-type N-terminal cleavage/methylation domain-containing protein
MKNKGFTLVEVIIAFAVLTLFFGGLFSLYSSGSKMGNSTMWLQSITNQLKSAARQINSSIRKSSYPSLLTFPQTITENKSECFKLQYFDGKIEANDCPDANNADFGKRFLVTTEATPAKNGYSSSENQDAEMIYHIFSLAKNGDLTYSKYQDSESKDSFTDSFTKTIPGSAKGIYKTVLVRNVESIECKRKDSNRTDENEPQPIEITINCLMPRSSTRRTEVTVGTPNVDIVALKK